MTSGIAGFLKELLENTVKPEIKITVMIAVVETHLHFTRDAESKLRALKLGSVVRIPGAHGLGWKKQTMLSFSAVFNLYFN